MPADCWSSGVILYIMLAYVLSGCGHGFFIPSGSQLLCELLGRGYNSSGSHPFDECSSNWISRRKGSYPEASSHSYEQADIINCFKERIVHGNVEFLQVPWPDLPDGPNLCHQFVSGWLISVPTKLLAQSLVESLLVRKPGDRATVHSALESRWISGKLDQLYSLYSLRIASCQGIVF
jgi:serine/threonine protein kinase